VKLPRFVLTGTFDAGFGMGLMLKDMRIALDLARAADTPAALSTAAVAMWADAVAASPAGADHTEIARWLGLDPSAEPAPAPDDHR
jgi:3-hydroxyisobutyrate dehydrogenase